MKELIIIKLGGSIITDKNQSEPTPRADSIAQLAKEISDIYATGKYSLVLVHGAGSFGHPLVKKHSLHKGMETTEQLLAYAQTTYSMTALNQLILNDLVGNKVPAVGLAPHCFVEQTSGQLAPFDTTLVTNYLKNNQIPVLHGDLVLDRDLKCSVVSGDTIIPYLAEKLTPSKVIFLTDVGGIFDSDPKINSDAKLIPEIDETNLDQVIAGITTNNPHDVTGEMEGKITSIKNDLTGTPVYIVNGLQKDSLKTVLTGGKLGTKVYFQ